MSKLSGRAKSTLASLLDRVLAPLIKLVNPPRLVPVPIPVRATRQRRR